MNEKVYPGTVEKLRAPARVALMEVDRVVDLCLTGTDAGSALDLGCGSGLFAEAFGARGLQVTGVDVRQEMVGAARDFVPDGTFLVGRAEDVDLPDGSFDLVFMGHLLHETDDPVGLLGEARRLGRGCVAVLEWPHRQEDTGPPLDHRLRDEQVRDFALQAGFSSVQTHSLTHMVLHILK